MKARYFKKINFSICMAKIEKINKLLDSAEKKTAVKAKAKKAAPAAADNKKVEKKKVLDIRSIDATNRIQLLLKEAPDSPIFFGKHKLRIKKPKKRGLFKKNEYSNLTKLRVDLNILAENGKVDIHSRQKVRADLRTYPNVPDLHVINAIYTYQDIPRSDERNKMSEVSQNKLNENQLTQLKKAIHEIAIAFHNGGVNVFNVNWFMKIYIEYLSVFKVRLTHEYRSISDRNDREARSLSKKIRSKQAEISHLLTVKNRYGGIARLSRALNGTSYLSDSFSSLEIKKATLAIKNGEPTKVIESGRRAANTISVIMTLLFLLAKVPILNNLVEDILAMIPEEERSTILRKRMVLTIMNSTAFELQVVSNNKEGMREEATKLYAACLRIINNYIRTVSLQEHYDIDPYLKAIWLIKSTDGLFSRDQYKEMLKQGYNFVNTISGESNQLKEKPRELVINLANKYLYQLDNIMDSHGWLGEAESLSWQSREKLKS